MKKTMAKQEEVDFFAALKIVEEKAGSEQDRLITEARGLIDKANQLTKYTDKTYFLSGGSQAQESAPKTKKTRKPKDDSPAALEAAKSAKYNPARFCKTCDMKGHDTKAHNFHKEKFTPEELAAKGWQAPSA